MFFQLDGLFDFLTQRTTKCVKDQKFPSRLHCCPAVSEFELCTPQDSKIQKETLLKSLFLSSETHLLLSTWTRPLWLWSRKLSHKKTLMQIIYHSPPCPINFFIQDEMMNTFSSTLTGSHHLNVTEFLLNRAPCRRQNIMQQTIIPTVMRSIMIVNS